MQQKNKNTQFLIVDLFCGAGGTTTGFEMTNGLAKVIACVNHDKKAIKSHWLNHPDVKHFEEDIRTLNLEPLVELVKMWRKRYPNAKLILWASLECTNFSKAKGGLPRDADSRTLADHLLRYIMALTPDIVQIENVVEFMAWGPLDKNGKPISRDNGKEWIRWRKQICKLGFIDEWKTLNSANYGAYTSRNRLFGIFSKTQEIIAWPEPTHCKNPSDGNMFAAPLKWKPVKEVLDLHDEGSSIFARKKELSDKTLARIYAGLLKYVAGGEKEFIAKYYSGRPAGKVSSVNDPAGTITTVGNQSLVKPQFLVKYLSNNQKTGINSGASINNPAPTVTTQNRIGIVSPSFLMNYHHSSDVNSIDKPSPTLVTKDKLAYVAPCFLTKYYGSGGQLSSIDDPAGTLSTRDRMAKIQTVWIDKQYTGSANHQSIDSPAGSVLANDKHCLINTVWIDRNFNNGGGVQSINSPAGSILTYPKLNQVTAKKFIMNTNFNNTGSSVDQPAPVITASRKHHYIVNPGWYGAHGSIDDPCCTIVARQDKVPLYLVATKTGNVSLPVYDTDSENLLKIKEFMVIYGIIDIKMRMLKVNELLKIQGFPNDYKLYGNQTDQKKFIGNSVVPLVVKNWIEAIATQCDKYAIAS